MKCVKCDIERVGKRQCKHCQKLYQQANKEKIRKYKKEYRKNNKEIIKRGNNNYYLSNKEKCIKANNVRYNKKYHSDPSFKLRKRCSNMIYLYINGAKGGSITKYLNYSILELKEHLEKQFEPWMTWNNHGRYSVKTWSDSNQSTWTWTWNIDHIIPQSDLPYSSMQDDNFKKCWALENLRPLNSLDNIKKSNRRII